MIRLRQNFADSPAGQRNTRSSRRLRVLILGLAILAVIATLAYVVTRQEDGADLGAASRFEAIHRFETADYHSLEVEPGGRVLFGHHDGLQASVDGGESWSDLIAELGRDAMSIAVDPFDAGRVYLAGHEAFMVSEDSGVSWSDVETNLPSLDLHAFGVSYAEGGRLFAYPADEGLFASDNSGLSWTLVADVPPGTAAVTQLPGGSLLLAATDKGILRSEDSGATWAQSRNGIDVGAIFTLGAHPSGSRVYAGTDHGVYLSTDEGQTWAPTALDDIWAVAIAVDPANPLTLYAMNSHGFLYKSVDGGRTW